MDVTADQIRAARALLHLEQTDVARRAKLSVVTIRRIEARDPSERVTPATLDAVRLVLEQAGVEFIPLGVRRRLRPDAAALYDDLRAISLRSSAQLSPDNRLTDADLYDENGLPA